MCQVIRKCLERAGIQAWTQIGLFCSGNGGGSGL